MDRLQIFHGSHDIQIEGENLKSVFLKDPRQVVADVVGQIELSESDLDCCLPDAGDAHDAFGLFHQCGRTFRKHWGILKERHPCIGINEKSPGMYSLKTSNGASKSGAM